MPVHNEDAALAEELKAHHAVKIKALGRLSGDLAKAAASDVDATQAKRALEGWVEDVLFPHAEEEEATTYRAAGELPEGQLLIRSMLAEHVLIRRIADHMLAAKDPMEAGTYGRTLFEIFDSHQRKENDIILPLLVAADTVSLTEVMGKIHEHGHGHTHAH